MKRLDHKNIVKLIGVCTKSEPVYTVMEFMLYGTNLLILSHCCFLISELLFAKIKANIMSTGDLKTYLLARRHLVYEKVSEDSDEVSNKRLTSMALDVARALSYLAELKYVHRFVQPTLRNLNPSNFLQLKSS